MIQLTNTLSGKKEPFIPLHDHCVSMYVCGITPYDYSHLGHGRCYVSFDLLYRLFLLLGYEITYCRNFTDIDDKIMHKALHEFGSEQQYAQIATRYIAAFHDDMRQLQCLPPTVEPRVTQTIPEIISFIEQLVDRGYAYTVDGDVYYSVEKFPSYGALSKRDLNDLKIGARVEINEKKKNPLDFALWKAEDPGTFWKSPWGYGRPGWHIECSAMAYTIFGKQIDIHAGGLDLIFPHHENEIAQTEGCFDVQFARYWLHNGFININKQKMSKSLGNFFTLHDIFKQFEPMVVRFYFLNHHYRSPLEFSFDDLEMARKAYKRIVDVMQRVPDSEPLMYDDMIQHEVVKKMLDFMCDDLNTVGALGILFEHLQALSNDARALTAVKQFLQQVWGLTCAPLIEKTVEITPAIQALLDERIAARAAKDWARSDTLRDQLKALGVEVQDKKI